MLTLSLDSSMALGPLKHETADFIDLCASILLANANADVDSLLCNHTQHAASCVLVSFMTLSDELLQQVSDALGGPWCQQLGKGSCCCCVTKWFVLIMDISLKTGLTLTVPCAGRNLSQLALGESGVSHTGYLQTIHEQDIWRLKLAGPALNSDLPFLNFLASPGGSSQRGQHVMQAHAALLFLWGMQSPGGVPGGTDILPKVQHCMRHADMSSQ